ncbi:MAG: hypothetical protein HDT42_12140 [Ruminococcaceae bacterium]|nr:hypothetical protein [Oscillospiraceae bacterium]
MLSKIKNSLTAKVFLLVFTALGVCCTLIYCILIAVLPKQYQFTQDKQLNANAEIFITELKNLQYEDGIKAIYDFCIQNSSAVVLVNENQTLTFGKINSDEQSIATSSVTANISFLNSDSDYTIVISSAMHAVDKILRLLLSLLPAVFLIIILLSVLSAFVCSKIIVSPIAKISQISKRMASLDMTWRCDYASQDEIGVLVSNLNTMALNLQNSMRELTLANEQLAVDVKKLQALDEQRGYFFAAASHELKTPLTILKGQIENMILGYGDYQNHEKYLPEALKATEDIERLVKEIITISKMESMDLKDTLQDVSIKQTVNDIVQIILPLAQGKQIQIHQNIAAISLYPSILTFGIKHYPTLSVMPFDILRAAKMFLFLCSLAKTETCLLSKIPEFPFRKMTFPRYSRHFFGSTNLGIRLPAEAVWDCTSSKLFLICTV